MKEIITSKGYYRVVSENGSYCVETYDDEFNEWNQITIPASFADTMRVFDKI